MLSPKIFLSASLLLLLCACGPPTSSDPAAKDAELVLYEPDEDKINTYTQDVQAKMSALRARLLDVPEDYDNYQSVADGKTGKTELRAGGTERMKNLPDSGAIKGQKFDSLTALNRDLLSGARFLETESEKLEIEANTRINAARAALSTARAENEWTDEEVKTLEEPILRAEAALADLINSHKTLHGELTNGEEMIMKKREQTSGTPNQH